MRSTKWAPLVLTVCFWGWTAGVAQAGVFPPAIRIGETSLTLRGEAVLRVGLAFRVYQAAFYLEENLPAHKALQDVPMRLEVSYLRPVSTERIISTAEKILRHSSTEEELASIRERIEKINQWYEPVESGDVYSLTYFPETGLELAKNGRALGTIPGHDFARLYLSIWLGEHPYSRGLNRQLLGGG